VVLDGYSFQVLRADSRKIHSLMVEKLKPAETAPE
jgi:Mg2+/Co2+ transporter CorC